MIKNYLKIAWRNLKRNKGYALLNMAGLAMGMASALLILLWVNDELAYDKFHANYDRLYQFYENQTYDGKTFTFAAMPGPFAPAAKQEIPEIEYITRTDWGTRHLFSFGDKNIYEWGLFADPDFLKMFSFKVLKGDTSKFLKDPTSLVITDKMAERFFGKDDPIGKTLKVNSDRLFTVVGVVQQPPVNSTIEFSWLASFKIYEGRNQWLRNWGNNGIQTYAQLHENADPVAVNRKLKDFISNKDSSTIAKPFLFGMKDWRLRSEFEDGKQTGGGRIEHVRLFSVIALLIIIIACINFMNLATARSEQRAREVGVRKVMGADRFSLVRQFFGESMVMSFAAVILAGFIVWLALPGFNKLVEKTIEFDFSNPVIWAGLPGIAILCGVLAGSYPSLYLSSFNPITVFRGMRAPRGSAVSVIRKGLVVVQFVISIGFIISTVVIYNQIKHVMNRQLGYSKDNVMIIPLRGGMNEHFTAIRNDLLATGVVDNAAKSNSRVISLNSSSGDFRWNGKDPSKQLLITLEWVSPEYISTMRMQLAAGRDFYPDATRDSSNVIINETLARIIGKPNVVGEKLYRESGEELTVVGVVKDFVYGNLYKEPEPLVLFCQPSAVNSLLVRLKDGQDVPKSTAAVESVIKKHAPAYPFEFRFMDEDFNNRFKTEMLTRELSKWFAILTIIISCLGLFGLAAYTAERRTREIGIRKVLGASVTNMVVLLSKDFLQLVALASILAFPLSYWLMHNWLDDYAYRINIEWWVFVLAGGLAMLIALLTVSFQAIKAALMNPVKSLRTE
jgi:putative ABC transport system permease protein